MEEIKMGVEVKQSGGNPPLPSLIPQEMPEEMLCLLKNYQRTKERCSALGKYKRNARKTYKDLQNAYARKCRQVEVYQKSLEHYAEEMMMYHDKVYAGAVIPIVTDSDTREFYLVFCFIFVLGLAAGAAIYSFM